MKLKVKVGLVVIALVQLASLSSIFLGIVGGFEAAEVVKFSDERRELEFTKINSSEGGQKSVRDGSNIPDKVVLMVIDALRLDMVTPQHFPFLLGSLKKTFRSTGTLDYRVTVDSPTVTLPRVKTLVTGKAPTYLDVLRNFQTTDTAYTSTTEINQDNLIWALRKERPELNICFFGDETWLRLFPADPDGQSPYFHKSEGVTSFFVKDFYEVDRNVTRNLENVDDCHFLILHYLGLDHVGHVYGPQVRPDLIREKLTEMDAIIQKLHSGLTKKAKGSSKSLILVTGDHGMANAGGHGGSSFEEVTTPLIAVITRSGLHQDQKPLKESIKQIDIAPTLAALWGLKIPKESRGQLILDIIEQFQSSTQLAMSYQENCKHLLNILGDTREGSTYQLWFDEISKMDKPLSIKKYIELEQELGATLFGLKEERNNLASSFGAGIFFLVICEMVLLCLIVNSVSKSSKGLRGSVVLGILPPFLIYFSSSFIEEEHYIRYFLYSTILLLWFYGFGHPTDSKCLWMLIKILALHRVAMSLNQTGDKWSHLPDLNDSIVQYNLSWLTALIGIVLIVLCCRGNCFGMNPSVFSINLLAILVIKAATTVFNERRYLKDVWILRNLEDHLIQQFSYAFIILNILITSFKLRSLSAAVFSTLVLFVLNLSRLQNFVLLGLVIAQLFQINQLFEYQTTLQADPKKNGKRRSPILNQIVLVWFVHASFFYQGNSNGLATIDVSAGYVGLGSFSSSALIAVFIFINTYGNPLIIYTASLCRNRSQSPESHAKLNGSFANQTNSIKKHVGRNATPLPLIFLFTNGAEAIVYAFTLIVFQNHLFIWSVFVPKLLYLIAQSVMYLSLCFITLFIS